jgi:tetratricopeptide (TPR) repeat protein
MGIVEWERGAYADALRQYETALQLFRGLDGADRRGEGIILNSLGVTLQRLRRYDEARTALEEGIALHRETGDRLLEAQALTALGDVCRELTRVDAARELYEQSLAVRSEIGDHQGAAAVLERLMRLHPEHDTDSQQE